MQPPWAADFLQNLGRLEGEVEAAARSVGIDSRTAYYYRKENPEFAARWVEIVEAAYRAGVEELARSSLDRAINGWDEPVFHDGMECGTKRRFSPTLEIFHLKCGSPLRYNPPTNVQVTEGDLSEILQVMALAVAQECPPELSQRIFDAWERDAFSKLRAGTRQGLARTVEAEVGSNVAGEIDGDSGDSGR